MQKVALRNSPFFAFVDDEDFPRVNILKWYLTSLGYAVTAIPKTKPRHILLHRFVMNAPKGTELDHINQNKLDCRKENLRYVTHSENCWNRPVRCDNQFGVTGICRDKHNGFRAYWGTGKDRVFVRCKTLEEAIAVRQAGYQSRSNNGNGAEKDNRTGGYFSIGRTRP